MKNIYDAIKTAMQSKDYLTAITIIDTVDLTKITEEYAELKEMWYSARYSLAEKLYGDNKPYEAYPYYLQIPDYKDVSTKKLKRTSYSIFGTWKSSKNETFVFNDDGTCTVNGKNRYYFCRQYTLQIGSSKEELTKTYHIYYQQNNAFTFKDNETETLYKLTRVEN